ncbi:MAG: magnesium transporter CorA family protein [Eggerthellaceae bacterium]|nr:magnesium transporter CorA family protein [Eggerthellaceae bacterium]
MLNFYKTDSGIVREKDAIDAGVWVQLIAPTHEECLKVATEMNADVADVEAALDIEEGSRIQLEDNYTLIIVDVPVVRTEDDAQNYTTIPLGMILTRENIVTICSEQTLVFAPFLNGQIRNFSTEETLRFVFQILYRVATLYQYDLRMIDRRRHNIEERIEGKTGNEDLLMLYGLDTTLVYFTTSLQANRTVIDKLRRYKRFEQTDEDQELLEDVIVENAQAVEMCSVYLNIVNGTRELMSSVINNRLSNTMKLLTSVTIVLAIPTMISGLYGMNVNTEWVPLASTQFGFAIICLIILVVCAITVWFLHKKDMLM